jgi:transcriptional regulator with XRE-family HTH domain
MTEVGRLIKKTRIEKGFSQSALADKLGVSQAFVNKVESGRGLWPSERIADICKALSIKRELMIYTITKDFKARLK